MHTYNLSSLSGKQMVYKGNDVWEISSKNISNPFIGKVCNIVPKLKRYPINGKELSCFDVYYIGVNGVNDGFSISAKAFIELFPHTKHLSLSELLCFLEKQKVRYLGNGKWEAVDGIHPPTKNESEYLRIFRLS